jgi:hypothetical protein
VKLNWFGAGCVLATLVVCLVVWAGVIVLAREFLFNH